MSFLAPVWIGLAGLASLAVVAIHLVSWRIPRSVVLPTARFVPDEPSRFAARAIRLSDVALLAVRVAILMAGGIALAQPVLATWPAGAATVVAIERSRAMPDTAALRARLAGIPLDGVSAFVVFDTSARVLSDVDEALAVTGGDGMSAMASLTTGLLSAIREATRLSRDYESVRITIVSTFSVGSFDAATRDIRALWPDSIRLVPVMPVTGQAPAGRVSVSSSGDDPVAAAIRLAESNGLLRGASLVVRQPASARDSAWADSGTLVIWPRAPAGAPERVDAVHAAGYTTIGHLVPLALDSGRVVARWANGAPAATEIARNGGCIRTIAFDVADIGDFVLSPSFQRVTAGLVAPCGAAITEEVVTDSLLNALAAPGQPPNRAALPDEFTAPNRLAALLLALAIALAIVELALRRRASAAIGAGQPA